MMDMRNPWILLAQARQREAAAFWRGFMLACFNATVWAVLVASALWVWR